MTVVRYINKEPYYGKNLPAIQIENPGVVMVVKDLQYRLTELTECEPQAPQGKSSIDLIPNR